MYVLVPIDKASNNIGFVCKKYYLKVLTEETSSEAYEITNRPADDLTNHLAEQSRKLGIPVDQEYLKLPQIHATIKMHKTPVKFRFIIGSKFCILKPAAKKLVKILQLILRIHKNYCEKAKHFTGIQKYWIIDNNKPVLDDIESINEKHAARNIRTYDFSTLYTKIPLVDLKEKLKNVVDKAFKGGQNQYIQITKTRARWHPSKRSDTLRKLDIFAIIDFVIDHSYFKFGDKVLRQHIGIPMGIDPAPQMANLYLYSYESAFMDKLTKENYGAAKKFNNTRRYIDDLHTINNDGYLEVYNSEGSLYPKEMKLNKENDQDQKATFLDLEEEIENKVIKVKTFDKRDAFGFEIVNYPDLSGNIPRQPAYGVFSSQIIRYVRNCNNYEDIAERIQNLARKLLTKNFTIDGLKCAARRCQNRHPWIREKLNRRPLIEILGGSFRIN